VSSGGQGSAVRYFPQPMETSLSLTQGMMWVVAPASSPPETPSPVIDGIAIAVRTASGVLAQRDQKLDLLREAAYSAPDIAPARFAALLAHAVCEVSALSQSHTRLRMTAGLQGIVIAGSNPIVLPDNAIVIDDLLRVRCLGLGVGVALNWEQGTGPCLVLHPADRR
jgi:hypothetical protein